MDQDGRCPTYKATQTLQDGVMKYAEFAFGTGEGIGVVHYRQAISNYDEAERKVSRHCKSRSLAAVSQIDTDQSTIEKTNVTDFRERISRTNK